MLEVLAGKVNPAGQNATRVWVYHSFSTIPNKCVYVQLKKMRTRKAVVREVLGSSVGYWDTEADVHIIKDGMVIKNDYVDFCNVKAEKNQEPFVLQ